MDSHIYLSLIIPVYNEQKRIASTLDTVEAYLRSLSEPFEIIVVNDGSTDNTLSVIEDYAAGSDVVRVITYETNVGKGYAVRQGMTMSQGEYAMFSDADLSAPIDELPKLFQAIESGYDIAIGSRAVKGAQLSLHQPFYRELGGRGLNLIIQALAVPGIKDTQCGFKLFKGDIAREIFAKSILNGWGFDVEALYIARHLDYNIAEVGVRWGHGADSKIHPFRAALQVIKDIIRIRLHNYGF